MKTGVLNLIPKADKDARFLRNLRPITLLNTDYKIIEKTLAHRLDDLMDEIISMDQTGFIPGRRIATNIRKVHDLMYHCKDNIPAVLLNLDYVKCFDSISFDSIIKSLRFFDIPEYIQTWVKLLYTNFTVRVQN